MNFRSFPFFKLVPVVVGLIGVGEALHSNISPWNYVFAAIIFVLAGLMAKRAFIDLRPPSIPKPRKLDESVETLVSGGMPSFVKPKPKPTKLVAKTDASKINLDDFLVSSPDSLKKIDRGEDEEEDELADFDLEEDEQEWESIEPVKAEPKKPAEKKPSAKEPKKPEKKEPIGLMPSKPRTAEEKKKELGKDFGAPKKEEFDKIKQDAINELKSLVKKQKESKKKPKTDK